MNNKPEFLYRDNLSDTAYNKPQEDHGFSAMGMVKDLAKFSIATAVLGKVGGVASRSIATKIFKSNKRLAGKIAKSINPKQSIKATHASMTMGSLLGGVSKLASKSPNVFGATTDVGKRWASAVSTAATTVRGFGTAGKSIYKGMRGSNSKVLRGAGSVGKAIALSVPTATSFYAIGRPLGMAGNESELPSWYNLPGHLSQIARTSVEFSIDHGFRAMKPLFNKAKAGLGAWTHKQFNEKGNEQLYKFMQDKFAKTIDSKGKVTSGSFYSGVIKSVAVVESARTAARKAGSEFSDTVMRRYGTKSMRNEKAKEGGTRSFGTFITETANAMRTSFRSRHATMTATLNESKANNAKDIIQGLTTVRATQLKMSDADYTDMLINNKDALSARKTNQMYNDSLGKGYKDAEIFTDALSDSIKNADGNVSNSAVHSVFGKGGKGYKMLDSNAQQFSEALFDEVRDSAVGSEVVQSINTLQKSFKEMYAGKGIFSRANGSVADYSMYTPRNLFKKTIDIVKPFTGITNPFGKRGNEFNLLKLTGLTNMRSRVGMNIHVGKTTEYQTYTTTVGNGIKQTLETSVADDASKGGLAYVTVGEKLWTTAQASTGLTVQEGRYSHRAITRFSRYAQLHHARNSAELENGKLFTEIAGAMKSDKESKSGLLGNLDISMPPMIRSLLNKAQDATGIGPRSKYFSNAVDLLFNPVKKQKHSGDFKSIVSNFMPMSERAQRDLSHSLSNPEVLSELASISKNNMGATSHENIFKTLHEYSKSGVSDDAFMKFFSSKYIATDDVEVKYIVDAFKKGTIDINEHAIESTHKMLSYKEELQRKLVNQAMGATSGMQAEGEGMAFNAADALLSNKKVRALFSNEDTKNLRMVATGIDLFQNNITGHGANFDIREKTSKLIKKRYASREKELLSNIQNSPQGKGIGYIRNSKDWIDNQYDDMLRTMSFDGSGKHKDLPTHLLTTKGDIPGDLVLGANFLADRVMQMGNMFGVNYGSARRIDTKVTLPDWAILGKFSGEKYKLGGPLKSMSTRVAQGVGLFAAWQTLDTFTDDNPLFSGTFLDEGTNVAVAELGIKASLAFHKAKDITGITKLGKFAEGLMPGSTDTLPGALIGGIMRGPMGIPLGMVANKFASSALPDMDKSYDEMVDIYAGREEVAIRKGRWWGLSKTSYEGQGIQYYRPHWFARMKSQYKYTDTMYGSKTEAFFHKPWAGLGWNPMWMLPGVDKYHYEKKHFYDRPYALSGSAFEDVPVIGGVLSATVGQLPVIGKRTVRMHEDELATRIANVDSKHKFGEMARSDMTMPSKTETINYMKDGVYANSSASKALYGGRNPNMSSGGASAIKPHLDAGSSTVAGLGKLAYGLTEMGGVYGFGTEALFGGHVGDNTIRHARASDMSATSRAYWDLNLGDMFFSTEFFRRFVPREKKIWNKINPLRNRMAGWLPGGEYAEDFHLDFSTGDPFTKVTEGEMRLPGRAYATLHDVRYTAPGRASSLGKSVGESVRWMSGLTKPHDKAMEDILEGGTELHREIQANLLAANVAFKEEAMVYDVENNVMGYIDMVLHDQGQPGGLRAVEVKTVSGAKFAKLNKPIPAHSSQINFYIRQLQAGPVGTLLYVNRDDPTQIRTFDVRYSEQRWRRDLMNLQKARQISAGIIANGEGYEDGANYSWFDRFRILADVAPNSKEYKRAASIVKLQIEGGKLSTQDIEAVAKIKKHRINTLRKYELFPNRFKNKVFNPDIEYQLMSDNDNMKAASEYGIGSRMVGSLWERFSQLNTPVHNKLWNYRTPLQHYQRSKLYGTENAFWDKPMEDIINPMFRQARGAQSVSEGATSFGWLGFMGFGSGTGGGFLPGAIMGAIGGLYGAANGGDAWVPEDIEKKRRIEQTFDKLKYTRAKNLYYKTGNAEHLMDAENTMHSIRENDYDVSLGTIMRSLAPSEQPYFNGFLTETDENERANILQAMPGDVGALLQKQWAMRDPSYMPSNIKRPNIDSYRNSLPMDSWEGFGSEKNFNDIKIKTIQNEGLDAHDFGLGWYDDMNRIASSPYNLDPISIDGGDVVSDQKSIDVNGLRTTLEQALKGFTFNPLVYVGYTPGGSDVATIELRITRDRFKELRQMSLGY